MSTTLTLTIDTIAEIERKNRRIGHHFFDAETLGFFGSRVDDCVTAHRFFVTSERSGFDRSSPRRATIRMVRNGGEIETVGEFGEHRTPAAARDQLARARRALDPDTFGRGTLAQVGVSVRFDPYPSDIEPGGALAAAAGQITERGLDRRFCWRAYVGDLPIGSRTTKGDAREIAREAATACPV